MDAKAETQGSELKRRIMAGFLREMKRKDKNGREYSYWVVINTEIRGQKR